MKPELPWLADPWAQAARALKSDRMPAGLLITGREGSGRTLLADAIARALLCLEPRPGGEACGRCAACREMDAGAHPDCLAVHLLEDKTQILVEQIRELNRGLALTAGARGRRCAIVSPAERLNAAAANALLKTLEEPPVGVTLILIADSAAHLLPTVTSRCLRLPVPVPEPEAALAWLNAREKRADWPLLLALSAGAPLAAERLAQEAGEDFNGRLLSLLAAALRRADPVAVANGFAPWPLVRFAMLVAWLAWATLRAATAVATLADASWWPREIATLAGRADRRRLAATWREASRLVGDGAPYNAELARERLILLFVNAFEHNAQETR